MKESSCCCQKPVDRMENEQQSSSLPIENYIDTPVGKIPVVSTNLTIGDRLGFIRMRWGIGRMRYRIDSGLYAVGKPTPDSIVLVSANYRMSFDLLRSKLEGIDAWIMVLDTKGINVWCAAGKGTFGTEEIMRRIKTLDLEKVVSHRKLIVPQLGAPGIKAHEVKKVSGFRIIYGPIRADDIKQFVDSDFKATKDMRLVTFNLKERASLIPVEFMTSLKYLIPVGLFFFIRGGFGEDGFTFSNLVIYGLLDSIKFFFLIFVLFALNPILLPWLPGKALSVKGVWVGLAVVLFMVFWVNSFDGSFKNWLGLSGWLFIIPAISSFISMNFTGATTYTSLSGVKMEMRIAVPFQIISLIIGFGLALAGIFT